MGYSSLLYAIGAIALGGLLLLSMYQGTNEVGTDQAVYHQQAQARTAALTGLNLVARRLADSTDWSLTGVLEIDSTAYGGTSFRVDLDQANWTTVCGVTTTPPPQDYTIARAIGYAAGTGGRPERVEIDVCYVREYVSPNVPPAFQRGVFVNSDLTLDGDFRVLSLNAGANADVHSNGDIEVYSDDVRVEGHGTYAPGGSGTNYSSEDIDTIFGPAVDENGGDANLYETEAIAVPPLTIDHYRDPAASYCTGSSDPTCGQYGPPTYPIPGDTTIAGGTIDATSVGCSNCGTADAPITLFVDGNLTITGDLTLPDNIQFVVKGTIDIGANVTASGTSPPGYSASESAWSSWAQGNLTSGETTIGFYAGGGITVTSGATVVGQLYSNGNVTLQNSTVVIGSVTALGSVATSGAVTVRFAQLAQGSVLPGQQWQVPGGVRVVAYSEWICDSRTEPNPCP